MALANSGMVIPGCLVTSSSAWPERVLAPRRVERVRGPGLERRPVRSRVVRVLVPVAAADVPRGRPGPRRAPVSAERAASRRET